MNLYQNYRPHRFSDLIAQEETSYILRSQIRRHRISHSYLFTGPSGVGKTSMARIMSLALNCAKPRRDGEPCLKCPTCRAALHGNAWDTLEFDAATFRGIDGIRELQSIAIFAPLTNHKIFILDEVHQFTSIAFDALLRMLEEPSGQVVIILCTTQPARVPETVKSRCQCFNFQAIPVTQITARLEFVCQKEKFRVDTNGLRFIANMADGNLRTALSMLDQVVNLNHGNPKTKEIRQLFLKSGKI